MLWFLFTFSEIYSNICLYFPWSILPFLPIIQGKNNNFIRTIVISFRWFSIFDFRFSIFCLSKILDFTHFLPFLKIYLKINISRTAVRMSMIYPAFWPDLPFSNYRFSANLFCENVKNQTSYYFCHRVNHFNI